MFLILACLAIGALLTNVIPERPTAGKYSRPTEADFERLMQKRGYR